MSNESGTVRLHRVLRAPAERVYKAFVDPAALEPVGEGHFSACFHKDKLAKEAAEVTA